MDKFIEDQYNKDKYNSENLIEDLGNFGKSYIRLTSSRLEEEYLTFYR
jgi:hypothetical protein